MPVIRIGQNTADGFSGCIDTRATEIAPTTNYGSGIVISASNFGAGDLQSCILDFTLPGVLVGTTINSVSLNLYGDPGSGASGSADVCELLLAFVQAEATWNIRSTGNNWNTGGARGSGTDRDAAALFTITSVTTSANNAYSSASLATLVGARAASGNLRLVILPTVTNGQSFIWGSSEATDGLRPYLSVDYSTGGGTKKILTLGVG